MKNYSCVHPVAKTHVRLPVQPNMQARNGGSEIALTLSLSPSTLTVTPEVQAVERQSESEFESESESEKKSAFCIWSSRSPTSGSGCSGPSPTSSAMSAIMSIGTAVRTFPRRTDFLWLERQSEFGMHKQTNLVELWTNHYIACSYKS